jgi:hypothetical protein
MKAFQKAIILSVAVANLACIAEAQSTLGSIKRKYIGQKVVLVQAWHNATFNQGRYESDWNSVTDTTGKMGSVIAIQLDRIETPKVNALGQKVDADDTVDPYFDIVVRLESGTLVLTSAYPSTISDECKMAADADDIEREMATSLPGVIGKDVYATGFSRLFKVDSTLEEMKLEKAAQRIPIDEIPLLVPLKITAAKFEPISTTVILKVRLPDGTEALSEEGGESLITKVDAISGRPIPFLERISGLLSTGIPEGLTSQEIAAIKKRTIFRGMSTSAMWFALGNEEQENDWGTGGKQFIFASGHLMVYTNHQHKIVNWQNLGE